MAENYAGVLEQECHREDFKALTNQIKKHESTMRLQRRWLMDLPLSNKEQKRIEELLPPNDKIMPESFLRKDDISYEDIKTCIKKAFGAQDSREESICVQDDKKILTGGLNKFEKTSRRMKRTVKELLPKDITDNNDISKTKPKRCSLLLKDPSPTIFCGNEMTHFTASESYRTAALIVLDELADFSSRTLRAMHRKLKGVKGYIPTLEPPKSGWSKAKLINAVRNKCMKMLFPKELKKRCMMLPDIGTVYEPAEQLAAALGVAGLTLKLIMNHPDVRDFRRFSPEMEALHNDIGKAIHLLNEQSKVSSIELRKVKLLLDPNSELPVSKSLCMNVRNLLIEYLYECSDMDYVPEVFIETLDIINGRAQCQSRKRSSTSKVFSSSKELVKEEMEKEIEHVLNISAQAKEVVANLLPEHEFDEEYAHAYMEDFEESDTLCIFYDDQQMEDNFQHFEFRSYSSYDQTESTGEINPVELNSPVSTSKRDGCLPFSLKGRSNVDLESVHLNKKNSQCLGEQYRSRCTAEDSEPAYSDTVKVTTKSSMSYVSPSRARKSSHNELSEETTSCSLTTKKNGFSEEETNLSHQQSKSANEYLNLQEACDNTSTVAYRFVGYMLDALAKTEGLELYQGDRLYLQNYASPREVTEEISDTLALKFSEMWKNVLEH